MAELERRIGGFLEDRVPAVEDLPDDAVELQRIFRETRREMRVEGVHGDPSTLTRRPYALPGGPTLADTRERHHILGEGGIVDPGLKAGWCTRRTTRRRSSARGACSGR